jgi:hypothetical protein
MCSPKCPNFNKFQASNAWQIATSVPLFVFQINKKETCLNEIHICVCWWENRETKNISSLSLALVKVAGCDFFHHVVAPKTVISFLSGPQ